MRAVSLILFVVAFVGLGIGTLLFAMSGGRGGVSSTLQSQSRGSRRFATFVFVASLLVLGIGVPAAVIAAEENKTDVPHAGIRNLTEAELHGQELFARRCGMCHTLEASNSVAQVGPNLDEMAPNAKFVLSAIDNGVSRGNGQMPADIYTGEDAEDVAEYVAKSVGASESSGG